MGSQSESRGRYKTVFGAKLRRMQTRKNLVAIDMPPDNAEGLLESLSKKTGLSWQYATCISNKRNNKVENLVRYIKYFTYPFKLFCNRRQISNLVAWQEFYGILFAFYSRLFHVKKRTRLVILTFMYTPKNGLVGKLYKSFIRYSICNEYVDHIVCFSKEEISYYIKEFNLDPKIISFLPVAVKKLGQFDTQIDSRKYIFSAGRSGRDFDFLIRSLNNTPYHVIIADNSTTVVPADNITIDKGSTGNDMLELMAHSYCVVTPLKSALKSAGHLMSLQAFQMGKPVICTDSAGMRPYLEDGYNGFFIKNTALSLIAAIKKLYEDDSLYAQMSANALDTYKEYSFAKLGERIGALYVEKGF